MRALSICSRSFALLLVWLACALPALGQSSADGLLDAGNAHTCAVTTTGAVQCWGYNAQGQAPSTVSGTFAGVSAGSFHTCAVTTTGAVQCWGYNAQGQATPPPLSFRAPGAPAPDLTLAFSGGGTPPSVTVSVRPGQASASATLPVHRLWTVNATGGSPGWTARVRLYYLDSEVPAGSDESTLTLGKTDDDGATWTPVAITSRSTSENWVEADVTSFSTFALVRAGGSLPVELASFTAAANGRTARLSWTTASETNNAGFVVERQTGDSWTEASGLIAGAGTTSERHDYTFEVAGLTAGHHTFRLRQTDTDGTVNHSAPITVEIGTPGEGVLVTVLGNGSRSPRIRFEGDGAVVRAVLYDVLGRSVGVVYDGAVSGTVLPVLPVLVPGAYVVRVAAGTHATSHRVVVR